MKPHHPCSSRQCGGHQVTRRCRDLSQRWTQWRCSCGSVCPKTCSRQPSRRVWVAWGYLPNQSKDVRNPLPPFPQVVGAGGNHGSASCRQRVAASHAIRQLEIPHCAGLGIMHTWNADPQGLWKAASKQPQPAGNRRQPATADSRDRGRARTSHLTLFSCPATDASLSGCVGCHLR